jgi:hypothetical protein
VDHNCRHLDIAQALPCWLTLIHRLEHSVDFMQTSKYSVAYAILSVVLAAFGNQVDIDVNRAAAKDAGIMSVPTFMFYKGGDMISKVHKHSQHFFRLMLVVGGISL